VSGPAPGEPSLLAVPGDAPTVLAGTPDRLRGRLSLRNPTGARVRLGRGRLRSPSAEAALAVPPGAAGGTLTDRIASVSVRAGGARSVPLSLSLDPHLPPGEYQGVLEFGAWERAVVLHVTESVRLTVSPSQLVIENRPGTIRRRVVVGNDGNVPLTVGDLGPVVLDDEQLQCRVLRATVAAGAREARTVDDLVIELARQAQTALAQAGFLGLRNPQGPFVLQPQEVRPVDLEIRVPDGLDRHTRYSGTLPIYTTDLSFLIVPAPDARRRGAPEASGKRTTTRGTGTRPKGS
jgi:hypothetical protein